MSNFLFQVATCLLFDKDDKLIIYLRDDKPEISFPNHWDLFGGIMEEGESPEQCLLREAQEELSITISDYKFWKTFDDPNNGKPNRKYVFVANINLPVTDLKSEVGQQLTSIHLSERNKYRFANILGEVIEDYSKLQKS